MSIKDSLPKQVSFCKYTSGVIAYMVIIGERRLDPDIWPKTPNQSTNINDMILKTLFQEAMKEKEINF